MAQFDPLNIPPVRAHRTPAAIKVKALEMNLMGLYKVYKTAVNEAHKAQVRKLIETTEKDLLEALYQIPSVR